VVEPLPIAVVGKPYQVLPEILGGGEPWEFHLNGGRLPKGMDIRSGDACICGTPEESGTFVFGIEGTCCLDAAPVTTNNYENTLYVRQKVTVSTSSLKSAVVGAPYTAVLEATGAGGYTLEWSLGGGSLPPGLTLAKDGTISGTPTALGSFTFIASVKDQDGGPRNDSKTLALAVVSPLSASAPTPPAAEVGRPFTTTLAATGGLAPLAWSISAGATPAGLTLDAATGVLSGIPSAAGTFPLTATVTDADGHTATVDLTLTIARALELVTARLRGGEVGALYSQKLRAAGGVTGKVWRFVSAKPSWLRLDAATGALRGTPRKAGILRFRIRVRDSLGATSTRTFRLTVRP